MLDVTAVLTAHREGELAIASIASLRAAAERARSAGIAVECLVILDRADDATRGVIGSRLAHEARILETDLGDPGLARNTAVEAARTKFVCFLDGDDLWSSNWIVAAHGFILQQKQPTIAHSEINLFFGNADDVHIHYDSLAPGFDAEMLRIENYWDAMSFGDRATYLETPNRRNDLARGYGHEDWHAGAESLAKGVAHRPVPGTVHFKRRREGSQLMKCAERDVVTWPLTLSKYSYFKDEPKVADLVSDF